MAYQGITSIDKLREAQAASQAQGGQPVPNYNEWAEVMQDLSAAGVKSTGSYEGDLKMRNMLKEQMKEMAAQNVEEQKNIEKDKEEPQNNPQKMMDNKTKNDDEQVQKAQVVNATGNDALKNYYKFLLG